MTDNDLTDNLNNMKFQEENTMEIKEKSFEEFDEYIKEVSNLSESEEVDPIKSKFTDSGTDSFVDKVKDLEKVLDATNFTNEFGGGGNTSNIRSSINVIFENYDKLPETKDLISEQLHFISSDYSRLIANGNKSFEQYADQSKMANFLSLMNGWISQASHKLNFKNSDESIYNELKEGYSKISEHIENDKDGKPRYSWIISDSTAQSVVDSMDDENAYPEFSKPEGIPFLLSEALITESFEQENLLSRRAFLAKLDHLTWGLNDLVTQVTPVEDNIGVVITIDANIMANLEEPDKAVFMDNLPK